MLKNSKRWIYPAPAAEQARRLAADTGAPESVWRLLLTRNVSDLEGAKRFLNPTADQIRPAEGLGGVREAVKLLIEARDNDTLIGVHGDYDVDGMTSTALYTRALRGLGWKVLPFVPHRKTDGYGVSERALEWFVEEGVGLVLTCDTGFTAIERVRQARAMGMKVIVTDHHLGGDAPEAEAVVNPNRDGEPYPFKGLCGVGVAFKVLEHLVDTLGKDRETFLYPYLDLVALGTVCDVMPLVDENRTFVHLGAKQMQKTLNPGLGALLDVMEVEKDKISEMTMAWMIGPRLNAVGRISDAAIGLELLLTDDEGRAKEIATQIEAWNKTRKEMTKTIELEANAMTDKLDMDKTYGIVLFGPKTWHHGVIGIVASRVVERTGRPAFLFAFDETSGAWKGSGRSGGCGANLKEALDMCSRHFSAHGGHAAAAGATIKGTDEKSLKALEKAFNKAVSTQVTMEDLVPALKTDGVVTLDEVTWDVYRKFFKRFAPFGAGNREMTFVSEAVNVREATIIGQDRSHLRLKLEQNGIQHEAVFWGGATTHPWLLGAGKPLLADACFKVSVNTFRNQTRLQLAIEDIRPAGQGRDMDINKPEKTINEQTSPRELFA